MAELYKQYVMPEKIVNGAKIVSLYINGGDIVFKYSFFFFQMPPVSLPQSLWTYGTKRKVSPLTFSKPRTMKAT